MLCAHAYKRDCVCVGEGEGKVEGGKEREVAGVCVCAVCSFS